MVVRYAASVSTREGAVSKYLRSPGGSDRLAGARPTGQPVDGDLTISTERHARSES